VGVDDAVAIDELPTPIAPITVANATTARLLKIALPRMLKTAPPFNSGLMQPMWRQQNHGSSLADRLIMP
jgi:hypothetical protein